MSAKSIAEKVAKQSIASEVQSVIENMQNTKGDLDCYHISLDKKEDEATTNKTKMEKQACDPWKNASDPANCFMEIHTKLKYDLDWTCFEEEMKNTYANSLQKISDQMKGLDYETFIQLVAKDQDCDDKEKLCREGCENQKGFIQKVKVGEEEKIATHELLDYTSGVNSPLKLQDAIDFIKCTGRQPAIIRFLKKNVDLFKFDSNIIKETDKKDLDEVIGNAVEEAVKQSAEANQPPAIAPAGGK